jgi:Zn-dependent M28 family amino/carboxypeptidase
VAVVAGLGRYLSEAKSRGEFYPRSTEVVLLGLSSEEAGLRGSKRYAAAHAGDNVPSSAIFLDGIYDEQFFTVFTRELWPGARMDAGLVSLVQSAAAENGFELRKGILPLGATDASAFTLAGIPSVAMSLWDTTRLVPHYHTRFDTIDKIRPRSLAVALQTVIDALRLIDAG